MCLTPNECFNEIIDKLHSVWVLILVLLLIFLLSRGITIYFRIRRRLAPSSEEIPLIGIHS